MNKTLSDIFQVKGRFRRSIHLERDFYTDENPLEGYIVTVTAREVLERIVSALNNGKSSKAWSLTGPYGSGKSAFALFTANLLGNSDSPKTEQALALLEHGDTPLYKRFIDLKGNGRLSSLGFCPVLISGERAPISLALLRGLKQGLISFNGIPKNSSPLRQIGTLLKAAEKGTLPQASEMTKIFESATRQIKKHEGTGILLVIDELGKFLEYATQYPAQGDMFVLQTLAEFADRSEETPLFLLTILHQAFEMYAQHAAESQREEWSKVQGRFEDIPFTEPIEQVLRLVGTALENHSKITWNNFNSVIKLGLKTQQLDEQELIQLLENCLPLHPTVALLIGPLFRRFAQNERSLFAFLNSSEPYGLQDFLSNQHYDGNLLPMFLLSDFYDYLNLTQGNKLYTSSNSKKWAEIESAINRLWNPSEITVKLIKTIGLLNITGEVMTSLKASKNLLYYALDDNSEVFPKEFHSALTELENHSIITYRRYNDTFTIWEGSDINIEARLRESETHVDRKVALATNLSRYMPTRPLVARRHLFETGTLRYFTVRYTDFEDFDVDLRMPLDDADGLLLYALPTSEHEAEQLREKAKNAESTNREEVLIAIPNSIGFLQEAVLEVTKLRWIQQNTPELQNDSAARRELSVRLLEAETDITRQLKAIFDENNESTCRWYHKGQEKPVISDGSRNAWLSEICDHVFGETPILQNELINRRKISGTVTAARRELIQAMLEKGDQENLGITGYPPEMSIYRSLLWNTGIHRKKSGVWGFHRPEVTDETDTLAVKRMFPVWEAIEGFFDRCETTRQPIEELYECLTTRPFGMRRGPLPILLCAAMLHYSTEVALYESGSFVPDLSMPVFERLLKAPQQFELKRFQMTRIRANVFAQLMQILNQPTETENRDLLTVVTPLMRIINQLPKYALQTQDLSDAAIKLREVVTKASEPDEFLFKQLPESLGFPAFNPEASSDLKAVFEFLNVMQETLSELEQAYDSLLLFIQQLISSAFKLNTDDKELRKEMVMRAEPLLEVVIETQLKGFLIHLCSGGHDFTSWIEATATFLANKPPASWVDTDKTQFEVNLSQLARKFRHFEAVSYDKLRHAESSKGEPIRVGITRPNRPEQEWVVTMPITAEEQVSVIEEAIKQVLDKFNIGDDPDLRSAILARISQEWMQQQDESENKN